MIEPLPQAVSMTETAVAIVDHQPVLCESLSVCLSGEPDLRVVGSASTPNQVADLVATARPDVLVYDAEFDTSDGAQTLRELQIDALEPCRGHADV